LPRWWALTLPDLVNQSIVNPPPAVKFLRSIFSDLASREGLMRPFNLQAEQIMQNKPHAAVDMTAKQGIHHTPARQVVRPTGGIFRGRFPSRKSGRSVAFESLIERDALLLFEFSRGVASYREQPYSIRYTFEGRSRKYTPDFELSLASGAVLLIEVKPEDKALAPDEGRRLRRIGSIFPS
jgi:hypothetical protein